MYKKTILFIALLTTSITAFAANCPIPSDFERKYYNQMGITYYWQLKKESNGDGWNFDTRQMLVSATEKIFPAKIKVSVFFYSSSVRCDYNLPNGQFSVYVHKKPDLNHLPRNTPLDNNNTHVCETTSEKAINECPWQWT